MSREITPLYRFLSPRYWPVWLGLGVLRLIILFPYPVQMAAGRLMGRLSMKLTPRRRRIAARNLELCFTELDETAREELLRAHFEALGMALVETALCWWASDETVRSLVRIEGKEHLDAALEAGSGVIMLTGHFTPLDLGGRFVTMLADVTAVYRPHGNALFDEIVKRGRENSAYEAIPKQDVRGVIRALRSNRAIWFAPDQSHRRRHSVNVPFFSVPAPTNTATATFARISGAPVVPFFPVRLPDNTGYRLIVRPPLEDFPTGDAEADATRINALLEDQIRQNPEQYLWVHRRFKPTGPDAPDNYADI